MLEKEAEEWVNNEYDNSYFPDCNFSARKDAIYAYIAAAEPREKRIAELEKENAELKSECRRCVYADCPCVLSDYGKKNGICDHFKDVFDEVAKLVEKNEELKAENIQLKNDILIIQRLLKKIEKLEKENEDLKKLNLYKECSRRSSYRER